MSQKNPYQLDDEIEESSPGIDWGALGKALPGGANLAGIGQQNAVDLGKQVELSRQQASTQNEQAFNDFMGAIKSHKKGDVEGLIEDPRIETYLNNYSDTYGFNMAPTNTPKYPNLKKLASLEKSSVTPVSEEAARMARAKEMGFDTNKTYYHGTKTPDIKRFQKNKAHNEGFYVTEDPEFANGFALVPPYVSKYEPDLINSPHTHNGNVLPLHARFKNTFDPSNKEHVESLIKILNEKYNPMESWKNIREMATNPNSWDIMEGDPAMFAAIKELGFDSARITEDGASNIVFWDPSLVRSKFAKFKNPTSKNLSAGIAGVSGAGMAANILSSSDANASETTDLTNKYSRLKSLLDSK